MEQKGEPWGSSLWSGRPSFTDNAPPIAKQAEAERDRRVKIMHADGELQASEKLLQAAKVLAKAQQAMQLGYLQTLAVLAAGGNSSTIVFPMPIDLMELLNKAPHK